MKQAKTNILKRLQYLKVITKILDNVHRINEINYRINSMSFINNVIDVGETVENSLNDRITLIKENERLRLLKQSLRRH